MFDNRQFIQGEFFGEFQCTVDIKEVKTFNPDIAYTQHHPIAVIIRAALPKCPIVHAILGILPFLEKPPIIELGISRYIAISEEVISSICNIGTSASPQVYLFRNVVNDLLFYNNRKLLQKTPKKLVIFSYKLDNNKRQIITKACYNRGIEIVDHVPQRPGATNYSEVPLKLRDGDIVITSGRGAIEAMMCGCVPLIMADCGDDGLVTPENFEILMHFNFSGRATKRSFNEIELAAEIDKYSGNDRTKLCELSHQYFAVSSQIKELEKLFSEVVQEGVRQLTPNDLIHVEFLAESYESIKRFSLIKGWDVPLISSAPPTNDGADEFRDAAMVAIAHCKWQQALNDLLEAHQRRPAGPFIRLHLARVLLELDRVEEALPHLDAVASTPNIPDLLPLLNELRTSSARALHGTSKKQNQE
jgi:hypothetical protein